jgi:predicted acylesterase/phospholipase RssA
MKKNNSNNILDNDLKNVPDDFNNILDKEIDVVLDRNNLDRTDLDVSDPDINNDKQPEVTLTKWQKQNVKKVLVLSGGSFKGVAQLGAMHYLKKHNMLNNINTIAATSIGTFCGVLFCAGYRPIEVFKFIKHLDVERCTEINPNNIMTKYGFDDGKRIILVLTKMLAAKSYDSDITFKEFYERTNITFIVTGTCVNDKKVYYFSHKTYPEMKVVEAIRISISVPVVFTPCTFDGKIFVDGGCIDNFPINLFKSNLNEVIGIYVMEKREEVKEIKYIEDYLNNVIQCLFEGITYRETISHLNSKNVIHVRCNNASNTQTAISCMFDEGYHAARQKMNEK